MRTKGTRSWVLIDTLDQYSWSTLDQYWINTPSTPWLTLNRHLGQHLVGSQLIFDWCVWLGWHLADYRLAVDQVSTKYIYWLGCWSSIYGDVDQGYPSRVSIDNFTQQIFRNYLITKVKVWSDFPFPFSKWFLNLIENIFSVFLSTGRNTCECLGELKKAVGIFTVSVTCFHSIFLFPQTSTRVSTHMTQ